MNKKLFMQFVAALITLATTRATDHAALEQAQADAKTAVDALEAEKGKEAAEAADNTLTDEENAQVQQALNLVSAATPPPPEAVQAVVAKVDQSPTP